jgi:hypothetical protein
VAIEVENHTDTRRLDDLSDGNGGIIRKSIVFAVKSLVSIR